MESVARAAEGWVIAALNPRGSFGFGQTFVDQISSDWAGAVMTDIDTVVSAVSKMPFADSQRMGIAGASYGGYAVNWILGHSTRFKAAVTHDGVFNLESMSLATEELWFPDWEFGGAPWTPKAKSEFAKWCAPLRAHQDRPDVTRARLPCSRRSRVADVHGPSAERHYLKPPSFRRGPLGAESAQQPRMARSRVRLAPEVPGYFFVILTPPFEVRTRSVAPPLPRSVENDLPIVPWTVTGKSIRTLPFVVPASRCALYWAGTVTCTPPFVV
jgi:hypothetical protein